MAKIAPPLLPQAAFADQFVTSLPELKATPLNSHEVVISMRDGLALATLLVRKGQSAALVDRVRRELHIELPRGPQRSAAGDLAIAGIGHGIWLATHERAGSTFASSLKQTVGDLASVSDQTSGYAIMRLSGPKVPDTLSKVVPIDVHPRAFRAGNLAITVAGRIGVTLWRLDDRNNRSPVFEIALYRSYAASFWHAVYTSAAEFGVVVSESCN